MVGAAPSFSRVHIVRTLLILKKKKTGRKNLVKELEIGEGSIRTILKRLKNDGLITSGKLGHELTAKGESKVLEYLERFTVPERFESGEIELVEGERTEKCLIVVYNSARKIKSGMEQRDTAFSAGAKGALVIVSKKGRLEFPTPDIKLSDFPGLTERLKKLDLQDKDTVVISFGKSYARAEDGAVAIALELL